MNESAPVVKLDESTLESAELQKSIERAKELQAQLEVFDGRDVNGSEELSKVENIALALSVELASISNAACMAEGLPSHPVSG